MKESRAKLEMLANTQPACRCRPVVPKPSSKTEARMYRKLKTRHSVPPNPLTILLGLASLKFGYITPRPTASPFNEKVITATTAPKKAMRSQVILSRLDDKVIRLKVTTNDASL